MAGDRQVVARRQPVLNRMRVYGSAPASRAPSPSSPVVTEHVAAATTDSRRPTSTVQHVLTAVAVNIERLHNHATPGHHERQATALQCYLIARELPIPRWWDTPDGR
jgi:hypothetical protein